MFVKVSKRLS